MPYKGSYPTHLEERAAQRLRENPHRYSSSRPPGEIDDADQQSMWTAAAILMPVPVYFAFFVAGPLAWRLTGASPSSPSWQGWTAAIVAYFAVMIAYLTGVFAVVSFRSSLMDSKRGDQ